GRAALTSENIDILQRKLDSFFRREDADPARIWSQGMTVELHCISHFEPSKAPRDGFIALGSEFSLLRRAPCPFLGSPTHYHRHFGRGRSRTKSTSRPPSLTRKSRY